MLEFGAGVAVGVGLMLVPKVYTWVMAKYASAKAKVEDKIDDYRDRR